MTDLADLGRVLVVAPHPDDEILGCGGTIARLAEQDQAVHVLVATRGMPPAFAEEGVQKVRKEMRAAHEMLDVVETHETDLPAAALDTVPAAQVNAEIGQVIDAVAPDTIFVPHIGDIHGDHAIVFQACMVAARPRHDRAPSRILCYETLSETNWYAPPLTPAFLPNVFIDISSTLERKLDAFRCFESQVKSFPEERSIEALEALARSRGATVHLKAAEAFMNIRHIVR